MSRTQLQFLLVVMIMGFLTGPRVLTALEKIVPENGLANSGQASGIVALGTMPTSSLAGAASADAYERLHLDARSVYVWDSQTGKKLYGK